MLFAFAGMRSISAVFAVSSFALPETVQILNKDGKAIEGPTALAGFTVNVNGSTRKIVLSDVLSVHNGEPASPSEAARIQSGLAAIQAYKAEAIQSEARRNRDAATEDLVSIGLPVMTPLLQALKDTDQHEPRALYRLFERLLPSGADQLRSRSVPHPPGIGRIDSRQDRIVPVRDRRAEVRVVEHPPARSPAQVGGPQC